MATPGLRARFLNACPDQEPACFCTPCRLQMFRDRLRELPARQCQRLAIYSSTKVRHNLAHRACCILQPVFSTCKIAGLRCSLKLPPTPPHCRPRRLKPVRLRTLCACRSRSWWPSARTPRRRSPCIAAGTWGLLACQLSPQRRWHRARGASARSSPCLGGQMCALCCGQVTMSCHPMAIRSMNKGVDMRPIDFLKACVFESMPEADQVDPVAFLHALTEGDALLPCKGLPVTCLANASASPPNACCLLHLPPPLRRSAGASNGIAWRGSCRPPPPTASPLATTCCRSCAAT